MTTEMGDKIDVDTKTKQLVDDLLNNPNTYESLITKYFNTFDIELIGLTYNHFKNDMFLLITKLEHIYNNIITELNKNNNSKFLKNKNKIYKFIDNIFFIKKNPVKIIVSKVKYSYDTFNILLIIDKYKKDKSPSKIDKEKNDIIFYETYIRKNKLLCTAYYNIFYVNIFSILLEKHNVNSLYLSIITNICYNYITHANKYIYDYQLYREQKYSISTEKSKQLINLLYEKNITSLELYNKIIEEPTIYFDDENSKIKHNILLAELPINNDISFINIHKFMDKNIQSNMLTKTFGLCNLDLYNILNNSNLPICHNNKKFFTLENDIKIYTREPENNEYDYNITITDNFDVLELITNIISKYINYFIKGYLITITKNKIYFSRNVIYDILFTKQEYENLSTKLSKCKERYFICYCAEIPFKKNKFFNNVVKKNFKGGHRVSLIFDTVKKNIIFFDPYGIENNEDYLLPNNSLNVPLLILMLALELSKNVSFTDQYTMYYSNISLAQSKEHNYDVENIIYNYNIKQIFSPEKQKLRDWAGGYCGLWNYLYIFLLVINPHLDLQDIYSFFYKITNLDYSPMFVKLLIRNFAYYIEQALVTPNYVIPLTQLDLKQFDDIALKEVKFDANNEPVKLRSMHSSNYYQKEESKPLQEGETKEKEEEFNIDKFIAEHTRLKGIFTSSKVRSDIFAIVKDFSKYLFAKGGLALYVPDKVNFVKV
jgi:hypothetical protein